MVRPVPEALLDLIRPEVRSQRPYTVPGARKVPVKLNQNESPFDLPPALKRELLEAFFQISFNRYPSEQPAKLLTALESHCGVPEGSILVGNGSNELTYTLGMCFIHPGDVVVLPCPMFALYESMIHLHGGQAVSITCRSDFQFDVGAMMDAIDTHRPNLVILTTPNNPTGLAMPFSDVEKIVRAAPGFIVVDEAYHEFNTEASALSLLDDCPNLIVMRTLSKAFGLAGLRLGFMVARAEVVGEMMKSRLPFMVDRMSEQVALLLLRNQELVKDRIQIILSNTQTLRETLSSIDGVEVRPTNTNFVLFRTSADPTTLLNELADKGVLVRNMGGYPELAGFLRVTSGTEDENKAFLGALNSIVGK